MRINEDSEIELNKTNITKLEDIERHLSNCKGYMKQVKEYLQVYSFFIRKIEALPSVLDILDMYSFEMQILENTLSDRIVELEDKIKMQMARDRLRALKKNKYRKYRKKKKKKRT